MTDLPANNLQPFQPSFPPPTASPAPSPETDRPKRRGARKAIPAAPAPTKVKKPRKAKSVPAPGGVVTGETPAKKPRKPKAAPIARKVKVTVLTKAPSKLGINEIVSATVGLKEDEAKQLLNMAACLDTLKKGARPKVMTALRKLFG